LTDKLLCVIVYIEREVTIMEMVVYYKKESGDSWTRRKYDVTSLDNDIEKRYDKKMRTGKIVGLQIRYYGN
jgi:hypothetical protein